MRRPHLTFALIAFALTAAATQRLQPPLTYNDGHGWDGEVYFTMARQIAAGEPLYADAPFVYRPAIPWLAATFSPADPMLGFKAVNLAGAALATLLLAAWLRAYLRDWMLVALLTLLFATMWHGPVRFVSFAPVYTDPWLLAILLAGLHLLRRLHQGSAPPDVWLLAVLTGIGVLVREVALLLAAAALFADRDARLADLLSPGRVLERIRRRPALVMPAILGVAALAATRALGTPSGEYGFARAAMTILYTKTPHMYLHAWFVTYGPVLVLAIFSYRLVWSRAQAEPYLVVYLLGVAALAWIGGVDTERFLYWGMPVVYLAIGIALEDSRAWQRSVPLWILLGAGQLIAQRAFWIVPDYPNAYATPLPLLTMPSSRAQYLDLYSMHGRRLLELISLAEYLLLSAVLWKWLSVEWRKARPRSTVWPESGVA